MQPTNLFRMATHFAAPLLLVSALFGESTPSPAVLITDRGNNALVIADAKDQHIVASIPVGGGPHEIAASSDGKLALVSNFERGNSISLIDLTVQKESPSLSIQFSGASQFFGLCRWKILLHGRGCEFDRQVRSRRPTQWTPSSALAS